MIQPSRGAAAIVGAAESDLGEVAPGMTPIDLMAQATHRALEDAGLRLGDIDGVFATTSQARLPTLALCEYLGVVPRYSDATNIGGASFMLHLRHAALAIEAGLCEVAVIAHGCTQRSVGRGQAQVRDQNPFETPFKPFLPATAYALAAARHMYLFGTTREQLAEVPVAARKWAQLNPVAWDRRPLTIDDVLVAPMVSWPLTVRDCCIVTDGGGALIVTSAARAKDLRRPPVHLLGSGEAITHLSISSMADLTVTGAAISGPQAYAAAGLGPTDIDIAEVYDAFSINTILFLEDLGFCPKGEGGRFVEHGRIAPGGVFPVNTNGGGLSYNHPAMYGLLLLVEAVRQLRGECGARQAGSPEVALVHGNGGALSSEATVILGTAATL
ncbi:MAG: thiolase [Sphingomicrobium sp.]